MGSTGAGINIERGVTTTVFVWKGERPGVSVELNNSPLRRPVVSEEVIDRYLALEGRNWNVRVNHQCRLPVGTGYGTSGAGAVSLSLALNEALGNPFGKSAALGVAHVAEVKARTGLGTVASVSRGGLAVRVTPGAPGVGVVRKLNVSRSLRVVSGTFGPLSTRRVLSNSSLRSRANLCGRRLVGNLLRRPDEKNFVGLSRSFTDCLGLISPRLQRVLGATEEQGVGASMMMLGDAAFCLVPEDAALGSLRLMRGAGMAAIVSRISLKGAHLL